MEQINLACTAADIASLLKDDEIVNQDYAAVKALINGEVDSFMGINFIRTELVPRLSNSSDLLTDAFTIDNVTGAVGDDGVGGSKIAAAVNTRRCMAWAGSGILMATASDLSARVDELPQKHYSKQVYASMNMGGCRMEEKKVMEIITK